MSPVKLCHISKQVVWRAIPSRFPPVNLFRRVADKEDWDTLNRLEDATNQRLRGEAEAAGLILPEDRVEGSTSHYILGPLCHPNPEGSEFSDGSFGVNYCAFDFPTIEAEVRARRERFLRNTGEGPQRIDLRMVLIDLEGNLHDLRGMKFSNAEESQALAQDLRSQGSYGLLFDSPMNPGGTCVAVFRPPVLKNARQERHFAFVWDGSRITDRYDLTLADNSLGSAAVGSAVAAS